MPHIMNNAPWFGALVTHRRQSLGMQPNHLAHAGGPSAATTRKIESGRGATTAKVLTQLDTALQWSPGTSARALVAGEDGDEARALRRLDAVVSPGCTEYRTAAVRSRPTAQRVQTRSERTRRKILLAVAETIARHGAGGSIRKVIDTGEVSKGALYFHFDSKDAAVDAVLDEAAILSGSLAARPRQSATTRSADAASAAVRQYISDASGSPILRAEAVLWNEPAYTATARAGTYATLRATLIDILDDNPRRTDTAAAPDAIMAILAGTITVPGDHHGLADPHIADTVQRLITPVLRGSTLDDN
ncbi:TetR/AcrR family transcriptional regulator [Rhodococcus kroppenstedtii]|uniref:Unannotated protein n=1 Tax=freshwater metagenome TaxID=449393 RepID=A0A6J7G8E9_9ZZZZ|nr:TetR/AcrR family transcriptional regulator [Rhodococcus kroppenstedtii]MBY6438473.1 TetR/AcrR family transcriptional regulator [Rhodococcus kroppenstedtii]MDV7199463.1 TetR/AcrR family transcriptional regulator [Rhodococcus kroppenstedtii]